MGSIVHSKELDDFDGVDDKRRKKKKKKRHSLSSSSCSAEKPPKIETPQMNHTLQRM